MKEININDIYRHMSASRLRELADLTEQQEELQAKIDALTNQKAELKKQAKPQKGRKKMSAKGRAAIAAAMKLRWKKARKAGKNSL